MNFISHGLVTATIADLRATAHTANKGRRSRWTRRPQIEQPTA